MEAAIRKQLLQTAKAYAVRNELALATVSRRVHGHAGFLDDFAKGKVSVTIRKLEEMLSVMNSRGFTITFDRRNSKPLSKRKYRHKWSSKTANDGTTLRRKKAVKKDS